MLFRITGILIASGVLALGLHGQAAGDNGDAAKGDDLYWIVDSKDAIAYRSRLGEWHTFKGHYNALRPADEVYCTVNVPPARTTKWCTLTYITADYTGTLTDRIPPNRWVLMSSIKDIPKPVRIVKSSRELLEEMGRKTQRAGLSKGPGCSGTLPVVAPACRETIDLNDFVVEWMNPSEGGRYASLFLDTIDDLQPRSMRLDRISLGSGRLEDPRIKTFFEEVQKDSAPTDVVIRLSQSQGVEAIRIVTIPSRVDQKGLHEDLEMANGQNPVVRKIVMLSAYVTFGVWSSAARQAREILTLAPGEEFVEAYALIGFCGSGYSQETEELRTSMKRQGIASTCPEGQK